MLLISEAFASGVQAVQPPSPSSNIFLMVIIFAVFYFFLIRPHKKQLKEHNEKISAVKKGDVIVTQGGIIGKVVKLQDDSVVHVKIAGDTVIQVVKTTISDIVDRKFTPVGESKKSEEKPSKTKKKGK